MFVIYKSNFICLLFSRTQLPIINKSRSVDIKHLKASIGVFTGGSPLTLKEVLTITGQPVFSLNFLIKS